MSKAQFLMIQGTHSDAGKSVLVTAFCRIFAQDGYRTAPFKSQNMALNSYVTLDGKEIGRAQGVQAEAACTIATTDMNPILIKPSRDHESQIVVHGKPYKNMQAGEYRETFYERGLNLIQQSIQSLAQSFDRVVIEGAGSPAEINLNDRELVNMRVAELADAPVILVGDIERGGVFASLVGTLQLLSPQQKERVIGVIINKFHGDIKLLEPGLEWFENYTGKPVLGVIPYLPNLNIEAEDSLVLDHYDKGQSDHISPTEGVSEHDTIDVVVIRYPKISNFTDVDPFRLEPDCRVRFITHAADMGHPDVVILPGSKNVLEDLIYLKDHGFIQKLSSLYREQRTAIVGICGGYQMLGLTIADPHAVESTRVQEEALGFLPIKTTLTKEKTTIRSQGRLQFGHTSYDIEGYEIHMGLSEMVDRHTHHNQPHQAHILYDNQRGSASSHFSPLIEMDGRGDGLKSVDERVWGTYFHGIFDNDHFRTGFLNERRACSGLPRKDEPSILFQQLKSSAFDRLAAHVRSHVQLEVINKYMKNDDDIASKRGGKNMSVDNS
ncbi:cobyric acid synthase [Caldalkalibacillus salinus]|uniref:cobyric acid synthase n=1 Tax=Caldalkalibacillus salinus TaxID=2803787 RepID=UPI0019251303|nr:cobyric acid synthase [Caldalkalibacillus salinus]